MEEPILGIGPRHILRKKYTIDNKRADLDIGISGKFYFKGPIDGKEVDVKIPVEIKGLYGNSEKPDDIILKPYDGYENSFKSSFKNKENFEIKDRFKYWDFIPDPSSGDPEQIYNIPPPRTPNIPPPRTPSTPPPRTPSTPPPRTPRTPRTPKTPKKPKVNSRKNRKNRKNYKTRKI
jgi:hypothetical protein